MFNQITNIDAKHVLYKTFYILSLLLSLGFSLYYYWNFLYFIIFEVFFINGTPNVIYITSNIFTYLILSSFSALLILYCLFYFKTFLYLYEFVNYILFIVLFISLNSVIVLYYFQILFDWLLYTLHMTICSNFFVLNVLSSQFEVVLHYLVWSCSFIVLSFNLCFYKVLKWKRFSVYFILITSCYLYNYSYTELTIPLIWIIILVLGGVEFFFLLHLFWRHLLKLTK